MSSLADVIEFPPRPRVEQHDSLEHDLALALATADDLASGIGEALGRVRRDCGATGAEWWAEDEDGALELVAVDGSVRRDRHSVRLGVAGTVVLHGGRPDWRVESALTSVAPIVRRRAAEERLERTTLQLARRNAALEDFAALVAHELKTPLQAALFAEDPSSALEDALLLVDALLEASRIGPGDESFASVEACLEQAADDLGVRLEVTADAAATLPLPPQALRVILRNLLSNAVAAGAEHVHVTAVRSPFSTRLVADDDGVGLEAVDRYESGSGLGLALCRRICARFGGALELAARPAGGTRAALTFTEALT